MLKKSGRFACLILALGMLLTACTPIVSQEPDVLTVYTTFYPIYALAEMVTDSVSDIELKCLVQPQDGCLRAYELSDWDIYMLAYGADAVIMGGCGLESFESTLEAYGESDLAVAEVLYGLDLTYGKAEVEDKEASGHWHGDNPHIYMSVSGAGQILEVLSGTLLTLDPENATLYAANAARYSGLLEELFTEITTITEGCRGKKTALMNEALVYVARDHQLDVVAQIERESGEALYASEMEECIRVLRERDAELVLIEQQAPVSLTSSLEAAGFEVAKIDILSTKGEIDGLDGYFDAQRRNAAELAEACGMED